MGFLNRVFGIKKQDDSAATSSEAFRTDRHMQDTATVSSASAPTMTTAAGSPSMPAEVGKLVGPAPDADRMYNPYAGLQNISGRHARAFRLPQQTEFVFQEEASVKRRGFGENLGYYTGSGYLGGAVVGGVLGLLQGARAAPQGALQSRRLLVNRLLNSTGQSGRLAGNTLGCLGLLFAASESFSWYLLDEYAPYSHPWTGTLLAGALAGAMFRSPRGVKASAITAAVGTGAAAVLLVARRVAPSL